MQGPTPDWTKVDHLVLDFGGVLYQIDHQATADAFAVLGAAGFIEQYAHGRQSALLDQMERGQLSAHDSLLALQDLCRPGTPLEAVQDAWNAVLIGLRPGIVPVLQDLAQHFELVMFSNTNAVHAAHFERQILDEHGRAFSDTFRQIVYSHRLGHRKPDRAAYDAVCTQHGLKAKRCFFVDDTLDNVTGARAAGWAAALHNPHTASLQDGLREMGCPIWG